METIETVIAGAGVVGLAVAAQLAANGQEVIVLETESAIGTESSSRNSEVIHAGIYYPTGSAKARLCVSGRDLLYRYLADRKLPYAQLGKVIVATQADQMPVLDGYRKQAVMNGAGDLHPLTRRQVEALEPAVRSVGGMFSPMTGIIDSHAFMLSLQGDLEAAGGMIAFNTPLLGARVTPGGAGGIVIETGGDMPMTVQARRLVNSAGLYAPRLAGTFEGLNPRHIPGAWFARGHYYSLTGTSPFSHLVYPVAEAGGLGVHVTLDLGGQARFGPDVMWIDEVDYQFDDSRRERFIDAIVRYYPDLDPERLHPGYTGIRPKISPPDGPTPDFVLQGESVHGIPGLVNLFGIESPGLTASLAIALEVSALLA